MNKMSMFRLDPCSACKKRYDITDINNINSCCSDVAAAFAGQSSLNALMGTSAGEACKRCLDESKAAIGKSTCDMRLTNAPVWTQVPHFFPELFAAMKNKEEALGMCLQECSAVRGNSIECKQNCQTDYDAVVDTKLENFQRHRKNNATTSAGGNEEEADSDESEIMRENFAFSKKCMGDLCTPAQKMWGVGMVLIVLALIGLIIFFIVQMQKK